MKPLLFVHIGDLHINKAKEQNYVDFLRIIAQLEMECGGLLDFVFLPGDIADHGQPPQYQMVAIALKMLNTPVYAIAGDHDMEQGSLNAFYSGLQMPQLPHSLLCNGYRCLFIDVSGPGTGGPDFRLGMEQLTWLENEMAAAKAKDETMLLFMHTYPEDLKDATEKIKLNQLIAANDVALVAMGHTHYNELANDGHTIFAATRSTGQIEEGPVGYTFISVQNGVVSWRFKQLEDPFPFVIITAPADYRLVRNEEQIVTEMAEVSAMVFGNRTIKQVACRVQDGEWQSMTVNDDGLWTATIPINATTSTVMLTVAAMDDNDRPGQHSIQVATHLQKNKTIIRDGSDRASVGAWPENGILGTQLGPNRNAKPD